MKFLAKNEIYLLKFHFLEKIINQKMVEYRLQIMWKPKPHSNKPNNMQEYYSTLTEALAELDELYDDDNIERLELLRLQDKDNWDNVELLIENYPYNYMQDNILQRIKDMIIELSNRLDGCVSDIHKNIIDEMQAITTIAEKCEYIAINHHQLQRPYDQFTASNFDVLLLKHKLQFEKQSWSVLYDRYADVFSYFAGNPENIGLIYKVMYHYRDATNHNDNINNLLKNNSIIAVFLHKAIEFEYDSLFADLKYHLDNNYFPKYWLYMQSRIYKYLQPV